MSAKKIENKIEEPINPEELKEEDNTVDPVISEEPKAEEDNTVDPVITEEPKTEEDNAVNPVVSEEPKVEEDNTIDPTVTEESKKEEKKATKSAKAKLKILVAFTDKYTQADYKVNDVISVEATRAEELLSDERGLVEKLN